MAGTFPVLQLGPATYTVSQAVTGGMLVEPDGTTGMVKPCTLASKACLGAALNDAVPAGSGTNLNYATARKEVSVAYGPAEVVLTATAAIIPFGSLVGAGALGTVVAIGSDTFDQAIGRCTEPAGIAASGTGRIRLF
jgi:hypothetical protein